MFPIHSNKISVSDKAQSSDDAAGSPLAALHGLLQDELASYGGGEAFLKSMRADSKGTEE
jgi:hypothetical protein